MSKFKVGDVVKRVGKNNGSDGAKIGQIATVMSLDRTGDLYVKYEGHSDTLTPDVGEFWYAENTEISLPEHGFTAEQLEFLSSHFNINVEDIEKEQKKTIRVKDGWVARDDKVWWKYEEGPKQVTLGDAHLHNVEEFPHLYSIKEPTYTLVVKYD